MSRFPNVNINRDGPGSPGVTGGAGLQSVYRTATGCMWALYGLCMAVCWLYGLYVLLYGICAEYIRTVAIFRLHGTLGRVYELYINYARPCAGGCAEIPTEPIGLLINSPALRALLSPSWNGKCKSR